MTDLSEAMAANPLIAILRGIEPEMAEPVSDVLVEAGFRIIEVPLNSPQACVSIAKIAKRHGEKAVIGWGPC